MQRTPLKWAAAIGLAATCLAVPAATYAADPENVIYSAEFEDGKIVRSGQTPLGKEAFGRAEIKEKTVKETRSRRRGRSSLSCWT